MDGEWDASETRAGGARVVSGKRSDGARGASEKKRLVVGVSGASGAALGLACLDLLREAGGWESHLVLTCGGALTVGHELNMSAEEFSRHADVAHDIDELGASIASGTFACEGMVVAPCSMKTAAGIACGYSENLLLRAADVTLKEHRNLVLMVRESPLSAIHADNLARLAHVPGVVLMPPVLTLYNAPRSIDDMVRHLAARALAVFGVESEALRRWA